MHYNHESVYDHFYQVEYLFTDDMIPAAEFAFELEDLGVSSDGCFEITLYYKDSNNNNKSIYFETTELTNTLIDYFTLRKFDSFLKTTDQIYNLTIGSTYYSSTDSPNPDVTVVNGTTKLAKLALKENSIESYVNTGYAQKIALSSTNQNDQGINIESESIILLRKGSTVLRNFSGRPQVSLDGGGTWHSIAFTDD